MLNQRHTALDQGWTFAEASWQAPGARVGFSYLEWLPAQVPGHVHLDLIRNGIIGEPFERMLELGCQWVDDKDWSYVTSFEWSPHPNLTQITLTFAGLDTVCTVSLNGTAIARHENMFVPLELEVAQHLVVGTNVLRVDFESAVRVGNERRRQYFAAEDIADDCERFDERAFVRKMQCMFGWDWGPRLVSVGIWRPVTLVEHAGRIQDVHVKQDHRADGSVSVSATSSVPAGTKAIHVWDDSPPARDGTLAELTQPRLWQPGQDNTLLLLTSYLLPESFDESSLLANSQRARAALQAEALDIREQRIGLSRVKLVREADRFGESFELEVNGARIYALGANWIPNHSFPSLITREALARQLSLARATGMNMLRVWGGGLYESDDFYELCDELGILVWQDFPFACSYYPDDEAAQAELRTEASYHVRRLRNHACLALWCGNNENLQMRQQRWGDAARHPRRYFGEVLYEQTLPTLLNELDPGRAYLPTSPHGGADCQQGGIGDQHYWDVWHGRGDWVHYQDSTARFSSEYGFASAPSAEAVASIFGNSAARPPSLASTVASDSLRGAHRDPILRWHDKTLKGYETFVNYVELHYPEAKSVDDWIYYSQLNQRDALAFAVEHYRRSEFCKGSLIWQLNDCWPSQSWALVDSLGQPKPALYELQRLYACGLLSFHKRGSLVTLWGVLDNVDVEHSLQGQLGVTAMALESGQVLREWSAEVRVAAGERKPLLELSTDGLPHDTVLFARLGQLAARTLLCEPKQLALPPAETLQVELADGICSIRVGSDRPIIDLWLTGEDGPRSFSRNLLSFCGKAQVPYSGGSKLLSARSLAGLHPLR